MEHEGTLDASKRDETKCVKWNRQSVETVTRMVCVDRKTTINEMVENETEKKF